MSEKSLTVTDPRAVQLLEALEDDPDLTVAEALRQVGAHPENVRRWRHQQPIFATRYDELLEERYPDRPRAGGAPGHPAGKFERFLEEFARLGRVARAARKVGIGESTIYQKLDPRSPDFDPVFQERFKTAEMARLARLEDRVWDAAEDREDRESVRTARWLLEKKHPEYVSKEPKERAPTTQINNVQVQQFFELLGSAAKGELRGADVELGDVVDLEVSSSQEAEKSEPDPG